MKKNSFVLLFIFITASIYPQKKEVCASEEVVYENLNEINKCLFERNKKQSLGNTNIIAQKPVVNNRYFIKRDKVKARKSAIVKKKKTIVSSVSNIDCAGVNKLNSVAVSKSISAKDLATYLSEKKEFVSFEDVDEIPLFKSCNEMSEDKLLCFNTKMANYISDNFDYEDDLDSENEVESILISFIINKEGKATNIKTKGYDNAKELHIKLAELIESLPTFIPAKNNGKSVSVKYEFEMNLSL